jgi:phosphate transport system substrate-binding protein
MLALIRRTALVVAFFAAALGARTAMGQGVIKIDGSSTVYPVTEAVAEEYQKERGAAKVTVGVSGTGGGFKKFTRGETDISNASRPILAKEMDEARKNGIDYIELPVAFDALTVVIHPQNTWAKTMTVDELKKLWAPEAQGKVMKWSDVRADWPNEPIKLYGPGADSGTFDYFTEAVVGKAKSSRGDYTASEDDNVLVQGVSGDKNALGYFGFAYFVANKAKLQAVSIVPAGGGSNAGVAPSEKTVLDGSYQPLSRPIFIYVSKKSLQRPEVRKFAEFYLMGAPDLTKKVKYVALPDELYEKGLARLKSQQVGTVFAGHADVGVKPAELFSRKLVTEAKK